jgi:predicted component of type VI protein secretion system
MSDKQLKQQSYLAMEQYFEKILTKEEKELLEKMKQSTSKEELEQNPDMRELRLKIVKEMRKIFSQQRNEYGQTLEKLPQWLQKK